MTAETFAFQAEVSKLLNIVARSLYSHKEIFLRELISNASDACDKLRHRALTETSLMPAGGFKITLTADKKGKMLTIADNGIGMDHDELRDLLGTIARSGTQAFVESLSGDAAKDSALIGRFGVGFYSAFMVADRVEVRTRKAAEDKAWLWASDGKGEFTITEAERDASGADVMLHLAKGEDEYLDQARLGHIVRTYSDHVGVPIVFVEKDKETKLNTAAALWTRDKAEITDDQYREFYHHVAHAFDEPWMTLHNRVEGTLSYTNLLFVPSSPPFDLFTPERKQRVKLYVNRVFITDDCAGLLPAYLRFLKGVVDSEDLSLNISREMLQKDPKLARICGALVKRVLGELKKKADKEAVEYARFWDNFGAVLKEGIYEDRENRDTLLALARFRSSRGDGLIGLDAYVGSMRAGQDAIYYVTGESPEQAAMSPQIEGFRAKDVDVLLLTDPVDEFWVPAVGKYKDKPFRSVTRGGTDLSKIEGGGAFAKDAEAPAQEIDRLIARLKATLNDAVKDVRASDRLTDSAVCLVAAEDGLDLHLERLLKEHRQLDKLSPRVLEINPRHALIRRLAAAAAVEGEDAALDDVLLLLFDQARIVEGETVSDPAAFARRLAEMMERGLA